MCGGFESHVVLCLVFSSVRAGDIFNGCDSMLLDSSTWREEGPGNQCSTVIYVEPESVYDIGYVGRD